MKNNQEEQIVLLASYQSIEEAQDIQRILERAGIETFLANVNTNQLMGGLVDVGGVRIEIAESNVNEALKVLHDEGIVLPDETDSEIGKIANFADKLPLMKGQPLERKLWFIIAMMVILLGILAAIAYFTGLTSK
ncbi:putative signal transducing protein [Porphyromonas pogonae]|uniref:putative signal transducing protein n=1 Tax=Porphyromonas pogonae TaxID=867595 RepID=UPI002E79E795|nr:DUF2007 domain-containing protein [Porphyromonas pogonae]